VKARVCNVFDPLCGLQFWAQVQMLGTIDARWPGFIYVRRSRSRLRERRWPESIISNDSLPFTVACYMSDSGVSDGARPSGDMPG
jgi:hypothetical protein